jgi:lysylphosphatidylglycerol synthetase-like protein (DUF2156 family)
MRLRCAGERPAYLGDEAIVDRTAVTLEGRPMKYLRNGDHRVRRAGYPIDPAPTQGARS